MKLFGPIVAGIISLLTLTVVFGSWYTVDQTERGVILRNGAFSGLAEPGLHFKTPWVESVVKIATTQRAIRFDYQGQDKDFRMEAYSQDQQPAHLSVSVLWHIPVGAAGDVYQSYTSADNIEAKLLFRRIPQDIKTVFGRYTAVSAIQDRAKLNTGALAAVLEDADLKSAPIIIDGVQIEDITFSPDYIKSVEQRMQAEVEVQKLQQQALQAEVQAKITVTQARAKADAVVAQATADATATKLRGEAEGDAIRSKGDALKDNPALVALIQAEKWDGKLPTTMPPNGAVPMITLGK